MTGANKRACSTWRDEEERERLLMEQLPQVRYIARRIHDRLPRHVPLEDLVHAGVVGLIDALHKYDASKHVQFGSYAKFRIRGAMLDSLREMDWSPRDLRRKARRLEEANNTLRSSLGRNPSEPELAVELGIDLRGLQLLLGEISGLEVGSLRVESQRDGQEEDLCEYLPDDSEETPAVSLSALRDEAPAGACDHRASGKRAPGADPLLLRRTHHEGSWNHSGSRRVASFADPLHGRRPAARPAQRTERWERHAGVCERGGRRGMRKLVRKRSRRIEGLQAGYLGRPGAGGCVELMVPVLAGPS